MDNFKYTFNLGQFKWVIFSCDGSSGLVDEFKNQPKWT